MDNVQETPMVDEPNQDQLRRLQEIEVENKVPEAPIAKEKEEPEEEPQKEEEEPQESDDEKSDSEVDESPDEETEIPKESRQAKFVRLDRHLKLRDKVKELTEENARLKADPQTKKSVEDSTEAIRALAEEQGMTPEAVEKFVKMAEEGAYSRLKAELGDKFSAIDEIKQKTAQQEQEILQEKIWSKQVTELVKKFPEEKEHIQSIEAKLKTLAYTEEFHKAPLEVIYQGVNGLRPRANKTVEVGRGGSNKGETTDFARIAKENDEVAINQMDGVTFSKFREFIKNYKD